MVNRNASIIMKIMRGKNYELEACELTCHEYPSNYEVDNYKRYFYLDKEEIVMKI